MLSTVDITAAVTLPDLSFNPSFSNCSLSAIDKALIWIFSDNISNAVFLTVSLMSRVRPMMLDSVLVDGAMDNRTARRTSGFGSQFSRNRYAG